MTAVASRPVVFAYLEEPPFCFTQSSGEPAGCDIALAREVLRQIGTVSLRFVSTHFDDLMPGLMDGRYTMTTGFFITEDRKQAIAFSQPIWTLRDGLLTRDTLPAGTRSLAALAADPCARLAVVRGQVQFQAAIAAGFPEARIRLYAAQAGATQAVVAGEAAAYLTVAAAHRALIAREGLAGLAVTDVPPDGASAPPDGGFGFNKSDTGLLAAVNAVLSRLLGSPWHRDLMQRYGL